jgi:vanillate/4-hydroxybenzoate decarboxylase subunit D
LAGATDGQTPALRVNREPVAGSCPQCGAEALAAYPVLSEGGWFRVTKCVACLHSVSRERWTLLGPVRLTSAGLALE